MDQPRSRKRQSWGAYRGGATAQSLQSCSGCWQRATKPRKYSLTAPRLIYFWGHAGPLHKRITIEGNSLCRLHCVIISERSYIQVVMVAGDQRFIVVIGRIQVRMIIQNIKLHWAAKQTSMAVNIILPQ